MERSVYHAKRCTIGWRNFGKAVDDEDRSGRPVMIAIESTEQQVEEFIRADRRVTIDNLAMAIGRSHSLAYSIIV
ncbi:hypothetical protein TNIN_281391 [Trichonephila inaurata madagascariensis]|uniref:Uncharacterized protein n=1 Tax=Trichonephila inaurata madagascariensis TaxID=2747483 RepID=A0A8X6X5M1_9ARAC|nr:hypothetical protein TNIN_281391 [Trichonephila inaurata madagascariensis]